jgi:hypothetical protein
MKVKKTAPAGDNREPVKESMRNFVQVPPMPRPIPAPKAKEATARSPVMENGNPDV